MVVVREKRVKLYTSGLILPLPLCLPPQVAFGFPGRQAPFTKVEEGVGWESLASTHTERGHLCLKAFESFVAFANPPLPLHVPSDLLLLCRAGILVLKALLHIWQSPLDLLPGKNPYSEWLWERKERIEKVLLHSISSSERRKEGRKREGEKESEIYILFVCSILKTCWLGLL